jgi:hypothetical protein
MAFCACTPDSALARAARSSSARRSASAPKACAACRSNSFSSRSFCNRFRFTSGSIPFTSGSIAVRCKPCSIYPSGIATTTILVIVRIPKPNASAEWPGAAARCGEPGGQGRQNWGGATAGSEPAVASQAKFLSNVAKLHASCQESYVRSVRTRSGYIKRTFASSNSRCTRCNRFCAVRMRSAACCSGSASGPISDKRARASSGMRRSASKSVAARASDADLAKRFCTCMRPALPGQAVRRHDHDAPPEVAS